VPSNPRHVPWLAVAALLVIAASAACGAAKAPPVVLTPQAQQGLQIAEANHCNDCHSPDGSRRQGPSWKGLWGKTVTLNDGTTLTADAAYITESIRDPKVKMVKGYPAAMAAYPLSDADINALIAYIQALSPRR
jgi:cytochrome c oxidase subunit 2